MSEKKPFKTLSSDELEQKIALRRLELSSDLSRLSLLAVNAYYLLSDRAKPVAEALRSDPIRRQQVYGNRMTKHGFIAADYLMVNMGVNHNLVLYRNFGVDQPNIWRHTRTKQVEELVCEETKLEEAQSTQAKDQNARLNLEVSLYKYPESWGKNPQLIKKLCSYSNNYANAELYIPPFEADLNEAIDKYVSVT